MSSLLLGAIECLAQLLLAHAQALVLREQLRAGRAQGRTLGSGGGALRLAGFGDLRRDVESARLAVDRTEAAVFSVISAQAAASLARVVVSWARAASSWSVAKTPRFRAHCKSSRKYVHAIAVMSFGGGSFDSLADEPLRLGAPPCT